MKEVISIEAADMIMCRACEKPIDLEPIFDGHNNILAMKLKFCVNIQVDEYDGLPQSLCKRCINLINSFYKFKMKCEETDAKLRNIVSTANILSLDTKTEIVISEPNSNAKIDVDKNEQYSLDDLVISVDNILYEDQNIGNMQDSHNYVEDVAPVEIEELPVKKVKQKSYLKATKSSIQKYYACPVCNEKFEIYSQFIKHRKTHGLILFTCDICQRGFARKAYLDKHKKTHIDINDLLTFKCDRCGKKYISKGNLERHMRCHTGDKRHICDVCGKRFIQSTTLRSHQLTHLDVKNFACKDCDKMFKSKQYLLQHREKMHNKFSIQKPFSCNTCSSKFINERKLKWHLSNHASSDCMEQKKPVKKSQPRQVRCVCTYCGKTFNNQTQLRIHHRIHTGEKPFECKTCHKKFRFHASFKFHEYSHTGLKPFSCDLCPKTFRQPTHLRNHQKVHTGARPHLCTYCPKRFASKSNLKVHIRIHTGERPYVCNNCGRGFLDSNGLKKHAKTHVNS